MKSSPVKIILCTLIVTTLLLPVLAACNGGEDDLDTVTTPASTPTEPVDKTTSKPEEAVVITIGNLSDQTGPASAAMQIIDNAFEDLVSYFNEENLIPGVSLRMITYDSQYDPSRDIPGYEWLKERGADLIWTPVPSAASTLKPRVNEDQLPLFVATASVEDLMPPGYVFSVGTIPRFQAYTFLKWIADNHWDYETEGPARIGGAGWSDSYFASFFEAAEEYADLNEEQFDWVDGILTGYGKFTWGPEVEALKNCDYVFCPNPMTSFVKEYRDAGYTGTFIGTDNHTSFMALISDAKLWDEIDGMLFLKSTEWWTDEGGLMDLIKEVLHRYHPENHEKIIRSGVGYISMANAYQVLIIIQNAARAVGARNVDSSAIYESAQSLDMTIEGIERFTFSDTKRYSTNFYTVYIAHGAREDIFRLDPEWHRQQLTP